MKQPISKTLPKCKIIETLAEKEKERQDQPLNFIALLENFRLRVSQEVKFINLLFPEYTPHDEEYHLTRLFFLGDKLLGEDLINNLNSSELLILSLSLYGHDWGMAVSEKEKEYILNGILLSKEDSENILFVENEHSKFEEYLNDSYQKEFKNELAVWQEYVRTTHANRSGERVRKYFEKIHLGLGDAVARVCEGHWLEFKQLQDPNNYPTNYSINGEIVNLKAIALYLRLIDLFDITEERTPYIIWKYVSPKDHKSKMEWEKHRAIYSISFPKYQEGRIVQIEGSTDNNNVYASLIDLKNWCDDQLKNSNDLLNQINDSRYNLNVFQIDWRVQARGFKPISIQFEFDRIRMFEVLSDEIYQGDSYVFLRELLQNSIDAIKLRREVLARKGFNLNSLGLIEIEVSDLESGDAIIVFSDDGIGMDEYIIRNYLSVAGKSYYSSSDFKKLGLTMDPISKFGVGVLSCFMVADKVNITTTREPYLSSKRETLKISIPSVSQQFRIESYGSIESKIGTSFTVFVKAEKIRSKHKDFKLQVTEYLKRIAGFVDIPIKINENGIKTIITQPENCQDSHPLEKFSGYSIAKQPLRFPWEMIVLPQSLKIAKENFEETRIDLRKDLEIENANGSIIFLNPKNDSVWFINNGYHWPPSDYTFFRTPKDVSERSLRIQFDEDNCDYYRTPEENEFGKSASSSTMYQVYTNGILLSGAEPPRNFDERYSEGGLMYPLESNHFEYDYFSLPFIVANFESKDLCNIDLSRTKMIERESNWDYLLWTKFIEYLKRKIVADNFYGYNLKERVLYLAHLSFFKNITPDVIFKKIVSVLHCPALVIENGGELVLKEWKYFKDKRVYTQPYKLGHFGNHVISFFLGKEIKESPLSNWANDEFILSLKYSGYGDDEIPAQMKILLGFHNHLINETHFHFGFRFLNSPWRNSPPLLQSVWEPIKSDKPDDQELLRKILTDVNEITKEELVAFLSNLIKRNGKFRIYKFPKIGSFIGTNNDKFGYGLEFLNLDHPNTKFIIQSLAAFKSLEGKKIKGDEANVGHLYDLILELPFFEGTSLIDLNEINLSFERLKEFIIANGLVENLIELSEITTNSFVKNSITTEDGEYCYFFHTRKEKELNEDFTNYSLTSTE